jgi:glycosyltransferase involved in cell wall biosynthesis
MPSSLPLVSVFMPCFNQERYVAQAIDSALSQDYPNLELVVGDDSSTDGTWEIVRRYQTENPTRIRAFRNERNLGITKNCNEILRRCTGKYIAFHAGDDLFMPGKLSIQVAAMERCEAVLGYHDIDVFDSNTDQTLYHWNSGPRSRTPVTGVCREVGRRLIEDGTSFMAALSVMVLRESIPKRGFDERIRVASDWLMWIDVCNSGRGPVVYVPNVLARYRRHAANVTSDLMRYFDDELIVLAIAEHRYPELARSVEKARRRLQYRAAIHHLAAGHKHIARYYFLRSMWYPEYVWKAPVRWLMSVLGLTHIDRDAHKTIVSQRTIAPPGPPTRD